MGETRVVKIEPTENPGFFAIIPAIVRYADITPNAKLLFGEISALTNQYGFCWASNEYFSKLYKVSHVSISKWINELIKHDFIKSESNNYQRRIYLSTGALADKEKLMTSLRKVNNPIKKSLRGHKEKFIHNNTISNTVNNKKNTVLYAPAEDPNRIPMIEAKGILKDILVRGAT